MGGRGGHSGRFSAYWSLALWCVKSMLFNKKLTALAQGSSESLHSIVAAHLCRLCQLGHWTLHSAPVKECLLQKKTFRENPIINNCMTEDYVINLIKIFLRDRCPASGTTSGEIGGRATQINNGNIKHS